MASYPHLLLLISRTLSTTSAAPMKICALLFLHPSRTPSLYLGFIQSWVLLRCASPTPSHHTGQILVVVLAVQPFEWGFSVRDLCDTWINKTLAACSTNNDKFGVATSALDISVTLFLNAMIAGSVSLFNVLSRKPCKKMNPVSLISPWFHNTFLQCHTGHGVMMPVVFQHNACS